MAILALTQFLEALEHGDTHNFYRILNKYRFSIPKDLLIRSYNTAYLNGHKNIRNRLYEDCPIIRTIIGSQKKRNDALKDFFKACHSTDIETCIYLENEHCFHDDLVVVNNIYITSPFPLLHKMCRENNIIVCNWLIKTYEPDEVIGWVILCSLCQEFSSCKDLTILQYVKDAFNLKRDEFSKKNFIGGHYPFINSVVRDWLYREFTIERKYAEYILKSITRVESPFEPNTKYLELKLWLFIKFDLVTDHDRDTFRKLIAKAYSHKKRKTVHHPQLSINEICKNK